MSPLRAVPQAKINFLFFQDIITSVMGILILVTLMLSLSLHSENPLTREEETLQNELRQSREQLEQIEKENKAAQQQSLTLAALPERSVLESQAQALRAEEKSAAEARKRSEELAAAAKLREQRMATEQQGAEEIERSLTNLDQKIAGLKEEIESAKKKTNAVYVVAGADVRQAPRQPVILIVSGEKAQVRQLDGGGGEERSLENAASIRPLLAKLDPAKEYLVFYFRPSGVKWFVGMRELARAAGFEVGYDGVEEQQELIFGSP